MEIIEQIGSYAGLAAIVGLAVLSALYFSQARDVKRLREWAGRAPERAPTSYPHRVVAQPTQPPRPAPPQGAPAPPPPVPLPPGAQPAAAGAGPAVAAGPVAATPAAARAAEAPAEADGRQAVTQNTVAHPPPRPPPQTLPPRQPPPGMGGHFAREAQIARQREEAQRREQELAHGGRPAEDEQLEDEHADEEYIEGEEFDGEELESHEFDGEEELESHEFDAQDNGPLPEGESAAEHPAPAREPGEPAGPPVGAPTSPPPPPPPATAINRPLPPRPAPPGLRPAPSQGPILPPYEKSRPGGGSSWENRTFSPMKAGLAVVGTVVVVAAAAFGVLQLTGDDDASGGSQEKAASSGGEAAPKGNGTPGSAAAVNPRNVTVSVLNGTTVGGLARQLADRLEGQGFELGNVTNNTDQQRAESVVLYAPGAETEARDVGRRLKISQREPIDADSQTRAGDARVVVVTGSDLNE